MWVTQLSPVKAEASFELSRARCSPCVCATMISNPAYDLWHFLSSHPSNSMTNVLHLRSSQSCSRPLCLRECVCVHLWLSWEWHKTEWCHGKLMLVLFSIALAKEQFKDWSVWMGIHSLLCDCIRIVSMENHTHTHTHNLAYLALPYTNIQGHNAPGLSLPTVAVTHCRS